MPHPDHGIHISNPRTLFAINFPHVQGLLTEAEVDLLLTLRRQLKK